MSDIIENEDRGLLYEVQGGENLSGILHDHYPELGTDKLTEAVLTTMIRAVNDASFVATLPGAVIFLPKKEIVIKYVNQVKEASGLMIEMKQEKAVLSVLEKHLRYQQK